MKAVSKCQVSGIGCAEKEVEIMEDSKLTVSPDTTALIYIYELTDTGSTQQDMHRFKADRIPSLSGSSGHVVPPLTKKLFEIDTN